MTALASADTLFHALTHPSAAATDVLPELDPPAGELAAAAFYRALPCAGWAAREICRQRPAVSLELALGSCLDALRERAMSLAAVPEAEFEERALAGLQEALAATYGELEWEMPAPLSPAPQSTLARAPIALIAEDCAVTRYAVAASLRTAGWDVRSAADGAEMLVLATVIQPDLVLLDRHLEGLDGLRAAEVLHQSGLADEPAIVFLTGGNDRESIARMRSAGACDVLPKPFEPHAALPRLRAQIELRQLRRQVHAANNRLHKVHLSQWHTLARLSRKIGEPLATLRALALQFGDGALGPVTVRQAAAAQDFLRLIDSALAEADGLQEREADGAAHGPAPAAATPAWIFASAPELIPFSTAG